jgi:hypothetical protein
MSALHECPSCNVRHRDEFDFCEPCRSRIRARGEKEARTELGALADDVIARAKSALAHSATSGLEGIEAETERLRRMLRAGEPICTRCGKALGLASFRIPTEDGERHEVCPER